MQSPIHQRAARAHKAVWLAVLILSGCDHQTPPPPPKATEVNVQPVIPSAIEAAAPGSARAVSAQELKQAEAEAAEQEQAHQ